MLKSSAFIPSNWNLGKGAGGVVNLVSGVVKAINHQIEDDEHTPTYEKEIHRLNGRRERKGLASHADHSSRRNRRGSSYRGSNGSFYDNRRGSKAVTSSFVGVVEDNHSIFTKDMLNRGILLQGSHAKITEHSVSAKCPQCNNRVMTVVQRKMSGKNVAVTATIAVVGIMANAFTTFVPLALAALDLTPLKSKIHFCAYCNFEFGKHVTVSMPKHASTRMHSGLSAITSMRGGKSYEL